MFDWLRFLWCLFVVFVFKAKQNLLLTKEDLEKQQHFPEGKKHHHSDKALNDSHPHQTAEDIYHHIIPSTKHTTYYHVMLSDLDWNFHMNNSQFLTALEFARVSFGFVTGLWSKASKIKANPLLMGISYQFRRDVGLLQKIKIETQIVSYDDRFMYFEQSCFVNGSFIGRGIARVGFAVKKKGLMSSEEWAPKLLGTSNYASHADLFLDNQLEKVQTYLNNDQKTPQTSMAHEVSKRLERVKTFAAHDTSLKE